MEAMSVFGVGQLVLIQPLMAKIRNENTPTGIRDGGGWRMAAIYWVLCGFNWSDERIEGGIIRQLI